MGFIKIFACLLMISLVQGQSSVSFKLFATDLFGCDQVSACDTVVRIFCEKGVNPGWTKCGETEQISDDAYPMWPETFTFPYNPSEQPKWKFDLVDMDVLIDDPIGSVSTSVADFLTSTSSQPTMKLTIPGGRGSLYIERK